MELRQPTSEYQLSSSDIENDTDTTTTTGAFKTIYANDSNSEFDNAILDLMRVENMAVPATYLCVGLLQGLISPLLNVYPRFLGASEAQQTTICSIHSIPSILKIVFGFISDNYPILGYRRKPYMAIGWIVSSFSMISLLMFSDMERAVDEDGNVVPSDNSPSIPFLSVCMLLFSTGLWLADVSGDRYEKYLCSLCVGK